MNRATKTVSARAASPPTRQREAKPSSAPRFDWPLANEAEALLRARISAFLEHNAFARWLAERMRDETGTDLFEWTDHLVLSPNDEQTLRAAGFVRDDQTETPNGEVVFEHPRA